VPNTLELANRFEFSLDGPPAVRSQLEKMVNATGQFIADMKAGSRPRFLSFLGTSGAGKTMLAKRVWRWWSKSGMFYTEPMRGAILARPSQWCDWRKFIEECLSGDFSRTADLCKDWFVVLDDIGAKRDKSGAWVDKLDTILASRSERLWTIVTANLSLQEISEQLDARIASRLLRGGSVVVDVDVPDYNVRAA
jgi:DNA replication protein DnaC